MSLASQVSALATRVATEFKNRVGTEADWAAQLTSAITAPTNALAASKTAPGIVQLASASQTKTGTNDSFAITPADLAAIFAQPSDVLAGTDAALLVTALGLAGGIPNFRRFASLTQMNGDTAPEGSIASLPPITTANGKILGSTWRKQSIYWTPLEDLKGLNAATLTDIKGWPLTYTNVSFDPRYTTAKVIRDGTTAANGWDEYVWTGTTFIIVPKFEMRAAAQLNGPATVTANTFSNIALDTVLSDPTGLMAPTDNVNFRLPWKGRYAISVAYALNGGDIPTSQFVSTIAILGNGYIIGQDSRWGQPGDQRISYFDEVSVDPSQTGQNLLKFQTYYQGSGNKQFSYGNDSVRARASVRYLGAN